MEVHTPIPESVVRRAPRPVRVVGTFLLAIALALVVVPVVQYTFNIGMPPDFRYYGTVETRFGTAGVFCGGDSGVPCGDGTTLELPKCTAEVTSYFENGDGEQYSTGALNHADGPARELLGKRPPSGDEWSFGCGNPAMIRGAPARLPNE